MLLYLRRNRFRFDVLTCNSDGRLLLRQEARSGDRNSSLWFRYWHCHLGAIGFDPTGQFRLGRYEHYTGWSYTQWNCVWSVLSTIEDQGMNNKLTCHSVTAISASLCELTHPHSASWTIGSVLLACFLDDKLWFGTRMKYVKHGKFRIIWKQMEFFVRQIGHQIGRHFAPRNLESWRRKFCWCRRSWWCWWNGGEGVATNQRFRLIGSRNVISPRIFKILAWLQT